MKNNLIGYVWQTDRHVFKLNKQYIACDRRTDMKNNLLGYVWQTDRHVFKLNKLYQACDRKTDIKNNLLGYVWQTDRHVFKLNKKYLACDRRTDIKKKCVGVFLVKIFGKERATKWKYNSVRDPKNNIMSFELNENRDEE